ncbi:hypothetical protein HPC49_10625 [Pyxidicoccus fallax]|uniref:Uncharacterized protein n=1 Tax=Pyxidicoccus fallax TaxID=394095 RepID=A0A848LG07_9BACT|nr:hypothetical protein [Pyxidicoccus fallax]NMO16163.1 hypothetical protein [Pyxidicoccus fallax]NPC78696.1 hypothetical protein [Pyxidicoccus fallax]
MHAGKDTGDKWLRSLLEDVARALADAKREREAGQVRAKKVLVGVAKESAQLGAEDAVASGFHLRPFRICDQRNRRHALSLTLNGLRLRLMGDANNPASRSLLTYLFSCEELRLTVVREGELAATLGRPALVTRRARKGAPRG